MAKKSQFFWTLLIIIMVFTIPFIEKKFKEFNELIFHGKLPIVPIKLNKTTRSLGQCCFYSNFRENKEPIGYSLKFSENFDLAENVLEDIIIHEMIHLYLGVNNLQDTYHHGANFKKLMIEINARYHRNVTIVYTGRSKDISDIPNVKWYVLAVVNYQNGKTGIHILPRMAQSIINYYTTTLANNSVKSIELYKVKDPFFKRYSNSLSQNCHFIDPQVLKPHLKDAEKMVCDGKKLINNSIKKSTPDSHLCSLPLF